MATSKKMFFLADEFVCVFFFRRLEVLSLVVFFSCFFFGNFCLVGGFSESKKFQIILKLFD